MMTSWRRPNVISLIGPVALLEAGGAGAIWLGLDHGKLALAVALMLSTAVLGAFWLARGRAARRLEIALDAYATREIAQGKRPASKVASKR
jgi:hypothetical protein